MKSSKGIMCMLVVVAVGLLLGLVGCHLYKMKLVEAYQNQNPSNDVYQVTMSADQNSSQLLQGLNQMVSNANQSSATGGTQVQMEAGDSNFYNRLPRGISNGDIPPGDEDLYVLKSEIVPPVCPACPEPKCRSDEPPPPCPPCARCPEPAFECKKVPNYNAANVDGYLPSTNNFFGMSEISNKNPRPVLDDFSSFN